MSKVQKGSNAPKGGPLSVEQCEELRARLAEAEKDAKHAWAEWKIDRAAYEEAQRRIDKLEDILRDCIEGFEGSFPGFWDSPLGLRLKPLLSRLYPEKGRP